MLDLQQYEPGNGSSIVHMLTYINLLDCIIKNSIRWPHAGLTPEGEAIPDMADPSCGTEDAPFQAVLVFSDPIDWYRDLQLITDVIMSGWHNMSFCLSQPQFLQ